MEDSVEINYVGEMVKGVFSCLEEDKKSSVTATSVGLSVLMSALQTLVDEGCGAEVKQLTSYALEILTEFKNGIDGARVLL